MRGVCDASPAPRQGAMTDLPSSPKPLAHPAPVAPPTGPMRWLPGLHTLRHYELAWLQSDVLAGLALTAVLIPVGIAYAVAAGVPAISGLYATIFGLLAYALFGPSRVLVLGPDSSLVALISAVVLQLSAGDPQRALALAGMMAVLSGLLCIAAGVARLGFITELLSKPIRYGYMNGIALTVLVSQLPALFGFSVQADGLLSALQAFLQAVLAGAINPASLALGVGTLVTIGLLRRSQRTGLKSRPRPTKGEVRLPATLLSGAVKSTPASNRLLRRTPTPRRSLAGRLARRSCAAW